MSVESDKRRYATLLANYENLEKSTERAWREAERWRERALRAEGASEALSAVLKREVVR